MAQLPSSRHRLSPAFLPDDMVWFSAHCLHIGALRIAEQPVRTPSRDGLDKISTLLALAFNKRLTSGGVDAVLGGSRRFAPRRPGSANIRLAHAGLARVPTTFALSERLEAANLLLDAGLSAGSY